MLSYREGDKDSDNVSGDEVQRNSIPEASPKKTGTNFFSKGANSNDENNC